MNFETAVNLLTACDDTTDVATVLDRFGVTGTKDVNDCPICRLARLDSAVERARYAGGYLSVIHNNCPKRLALSEACELFSERWHL